MTAVAALAEPRRVPPESTRADREGHLWWYARQRQRVHDRRAAGDPPPWTDDPLLARHRFCEVHREDDRGTRWIRAWRAGHELLDGPDALYAYLAYRLLNSVDTSEECGIPFRDAPGLDAWHARLLGRRADGRVVGTRRHFTHGPDAAARTLGQVLRPGPLEAATTEGSALGAAAELLAIGGVGPFFALQTVADWLGDPLCPLPADSEVPIATGSHMALRLLLDGDWLDNAGGQHGAHRAWDDEGDLAAVRYLVGHQPMISGARLTPVDMEHTLCEWYKYARRAAGLSARLVRYP